jgi:hypothetical protein
VAEAVPGPGASNSALEAAIDRLADGTRLREAESAVADVAPAIQRVLAAALASGGWFEGSHRSELERVAALEDPEERLTAIATLLAEETRIAMMVGVTLGWSLSDELAGSPGDVPEA